MKNKRNTIKNNTKTKMGEMEGPGVKGATGNVNYCKMDTATPPALTDKYLCYRAANNFTSLVEMLYKFRVT